MANSEEEGRAVKLATQALELVAAGHEEEGFRALREAASLAPDNPEVKTAFQKIQKESFEHPLKRLCWKFTLEANEEAGHEAIRYLNRSAEVPGDVAKECMELVMRPRHTSNPEIQDGIFSGLLRESVQAKAYLAKALHEAKDNALFEDIYELGKGAAYGIVTVVLDPNAWTTEAARDGVERDIFQLYLAKLLEVGDEHNGRALKGIARMLATDPDKLHGYVDEDCFELMLCCLDYRNSTEVRSQATMAVAKFLEVSADEGQKLLIQFVTTRFRRQYNEDLVLAFSAAAGVFPVAPSIASALFLTPGFVPALIPLLEKKAKSEKVEQAALNMLSAACVDSACREAVGKHCTSWLQQILKTGKGQKPGLVAVILAKLQGPSEKNQSPEARVKDVDEDVEDLIPRLKRMIDAKSEESEQSSIEGLAYCSIQPKVKDQLAKDSDLLKKILHALDKASPGSPLVFGGLTLLDNLTRFLPNLSEEQKRMAQLKAYANASKATTEKVHPLDEAPAVTERCKTVVNAGVVPVLTSLSKSLSPNSLAVVFTIMSSISRITPLRGTIAQQGGVRLLLTNYTSISGTSQTDTKSRRTAAHALALILISTDPSLLFPASGSMPVSSAIRPLLSLLTEDSALPSEGPRDLLPTFEALLALTNIASLPSGTPSEAIINQSWPTVEDLLLSNNTLIRRASTQLVCNLVNCAKGIELFADESPAAARRLHILLAMADVEDKETRKAAGGALASVLQFEGAVNLVMKRERGVEILLRLCEDEDEELIHRGVVCVFEILSQDGVMGQRSCAEVKELGGLETLLVMKESRNQAIREAADQALRILQ